MLPKSEIVRRGYKCRTKEITLKLRDHQLKTVMYIYICTLLYENFRVTANQESSIDTQRTKINSNTTLKIVIKPQEEKTRQEGKKK